MRRTLEALSTGKKLPPYADAFFLSGLREFADDLRRTRCIATVISDEESFQINEGLIRQIESRLGAERIAYSTITGKMDVLNVHGSGWTFTIFPVIGPKRVICRFDRQHLDQVKSLVKDTVEVFGPAVYTGVSPWPVKMRAERIRIINPAPARAWANMPDTLRSHWESATEEERDLVRFGEQIA
jgi:hypothetical protein